MKKISTVQAFSNEIFKEQKLTIGLDLGNYWPYYCVLDEAGKIILKQKVPTTTEGIKQTLGKMLKATTAAACGAPRPPYRSSRNLTTLSYLARGLREAVKRVSRLLTGKFLSG